MEKVRKRGKMNLEWRRKKIYDDYKSGKMLTGELKQILIDKITNFLKGHHKKMKLAKKDLNKFIDKWYWVRKMLYQFIQ